MAPPRRVFAALTASALLMLLSLTVLASNAPANQPLDRRGNVIISPSATNNFDQLVVVLMENKNLNEVYGPAPYMTQLADQYSFSQGWSSITNPSQPNYIALLGASTFGVGGDGNHPNLNHPTLVDLIETSGHTWNAIAEGSGSGCSINPDRGEDHFPFLSYTTITGNPARCANLLEDVWGGGSLGQGDVNAPSPLEFFGAGGPPVPDFSIAANPASLSFVPSQSATSTISLQSTGGFTGSVALTMASAPAGVTGSCSPSTVSGSQTSTCSLTGTTAGSYTVTVTGASGSLIHTTSISVSVTANPPPPGGGPPGGRDPLLWPFSRDSIWNLPIGASAVYVSANIQQATQRGMTTDPDVIILTPNATMTAVYYNSDGWSGGSRCTPQGNVLFNAPIPGNFVVQGAGASNPDGVTPTYATAILMPDGHTLTQGH